MAVGRLDALEHGRRACAEGAWATADDALTLADEQGMLGAEDLELLATAAYMLGRTEDYVAALGRAHDAYVARDAVLGAARCAVWIGITLALRGKLGHAGGWLGRAQRLVDRHGADCVEAAYLLVPGMFEREASGDLGGAIAIAAEIVATGQRFGDRDLVALATHTQGHLLVLDGRVDEGLPLLDEAMVNVTSGETSPIPTGIVYCGVIVGCQAAYELRRATEWTSALAGWCERQPEMVAFSGRCMVHRAELLQLRGAWQEALDEVRRGRARCLEADNVPAAADAAYLRGELHRLRGEVAEAETAYREASREGHEPHPGLALLWLSRGDAPAAVAALRRVLTETLAPAERARILPAVVEAMLATGDIGAAGEACRELEDLAASHGAELLVARAAACAGDIALAGGDLDAALLSLRRAAAALQELGAPYEGARVRVLLGRACRMLGDQESAVLDLQAARDTFDRLGARPDVARVDVLLGRAAEDRDGLTARELEVLRLVAGGATNKAIAAELILSERTVDRHVSNILAKLRVASRAAATAYAYEHRLL